MDNAILRINHYPVDSVVFFVNTYPLEQLIQCTGYERTFKGIHKQHINKKTSQNENRRKSNERKRKRTENNVQRVYGTCAHLETRQEMILCTLLTWPSQKSVLKWRILPRRYLHEMGHTSHSAWKGIISPMLQEAESPPTLSHRLPLHLHVP